VVEPRSRWPTSRKRPDRRRGVGGTADRADPGAAAGAEARLGRCVGVGASVGPLVVTGFTDLPGVFLGVGALAAGFGLFFLSLRRVNRQMVAVKQRELQLALDLYMQAYRPVRDQPSLEMLQRQADLLKAAEDLESAPNASWSGPSTSQPSPASSPSPAASPPPSSLASSWGRSAFSQD
jgi:hypothetical protein